MSHRWLAASVVVLLPTALASAQPVQSPPIPITRNAPDSLDQPTQYAPLLRPPAPDPPLAEVPRGPSGNYDHNLLYLPEYAPSAAPEGCRPLGRWWVSPTLEFAWLPSKPAPGAVQLERANARRRFDSGADLAAGGALRGYLSGRVRAQFWHVVRPPKHARH